MFSSRRPSLPRSSAAAAAAATDSPCSVASVFFGQKEDRPADLGRISVKKFPDQYPAEKVLQAEPVKGDTKEMAVIRPLLKQTELGEKRGWRRGGVNLRLENVITIIGTN